ncbi:Bacterial regulatory protein, LuxR family:Response regulator receiver [Nitrococcus mobilis Nb-231]|uniref:Bacterial regulatory protein, LuxR family:Response regulator receiver n=2 Tax=Nitrococcus mobilis TaxID=35797 RepID=A4BRF3_9GAMM|nr:Bacterial regulatory protein, LuxR family:Response regulator receiver [Nitrococcus mobilis Nb-231]
MSVTQLLEASTHAKRRSEDFIILPFSSADEFLSCRLSFTVKLILLSVGSGCVSEETVCNDIDRLKQGLVDVPVVILSEREEPHCILKALRLGVHSYISTGLNPEVVILALRLIQAGGSFIPSSILLEPFEGKRSVKEQSGMFAPTLLQGLTPRQSEVLQLLREGKSNKIIAYELKMQESTVKVHVRQIMKKFKAINRTHAAFLANRLYEKKGLERKARESETDN